ncbi:nucleolar protein 10 lethal (2) 34Fd isoform X2 [Tachypleus tridentatus]
MPGVSTSVRVSGDGQYVLATGVYKPRVRCYDINQLSMKFERCFDSEVVSFEILSDDYSKLVFLQCDRYLEFHAAYGRYHRIRIPKFGRDMAYHYASCDLYCVGASSEVYRINLEQGRFLNSLQTDANSLSVCKINPVHHLFVCGTNEGRVEAWDPRSRHRVGILDCALSSVTGETEVNGIPSVTALSFKDGLQMAVGTATGQILLYDIRASSPLLVKDHMYGLPIKDIEFYPSMDLVVSIDRKIVKLWDRTTGKPFTSIQPQTDLNDLCLYPNSGMMFLTNEDRKILTYYIPSLGPAPRWCSFLDSLTEELEESSHNTVYDDYKFVTRRELEDLGLLHLIGSNLLRAYMHGFFMDIRLYHMAKAIANPFAYEEYRRKKIREKIEAERANRVKVKKLPAVNKELAKKLIDKEQDEKHKTKKGPNLLEDDRFKAIFENPDFEVNEASEEYRMLNPHITKLDKSKKKKKQEKTSNTLTGQFELLEEGSEKNQESSESDESSSDDDRAWTQELKKTYRSIRREERLKKDESDVDVHSQPRFYELKEGQQFFSYRKPGIKMMSGNSMASLGERLESVDKEDEAVGQRDLSSGSRTMTFTLNKSKQQMKREEENKRHLEERRTLSRSAKGIMSKPRSKFWQHSRGRLK